MPPTLYLIRHAEAEHNVKFRFTPPRFHIPDPILTPRGRTECQNLRKPFPHHNKIDLILSSPHRRAIETTLFSFSNTLARPEVPYLLVPNAQEVIAKPCDIGFSLDILKNDEGLAFGAEKIDFDLMEDEWNSKKDFYAPNHGAVETRAAALRAWLYGLEAQYIILVAHGGFLYYLTEDGTVSDPKKGTGYNNCEVRTFTFTKDSTAERARIVEVGMKRHGVETDNTILAELNEVG
ncbi:uncharacterized protein EAF01_001563 [Botrytis porri]|uniref:uncharacterized protein n=1 Tax=Botrytis porri TaxID=87229 RepID=UPI001901FEAA|nr:uncharacterized protein EAF01_001563 [Botrytis porri]KAF7912542.1 hypothetical protein EAF01_001563 [Botrytis porri]